MKNEVRNRDHTGREFRSISEMCGFYGIPRTTYLDRMRNGWSQEDALTKHAERTLGIDHLWLRKRMNCGMEAEIVMYHDSDHIVVEFDDGEMADGSLSNFYKGKIAHPMIRSKGFGQYGCVSIALAWKDDENSYYHVICEKCNSIRDIWTDEKLANFHQPSWSNHTSMDCCKCCLKDDYLTTICSSV